MEKFKLIYDKLDKFVNDKFDINLSFILLAVFIFIVANFG